MNLILINKTEVTEPNYIDGNNDFILKTNFGDCLVSGLKIKLLESFGSFNEELTSNTLLFCYQQLTEIK